MKSSFRLIGPLATGTTTGSRADIVAGLMHVFDASLATKVKEDAKNTRPGLTRAAIPYQGSTLELPDTANANTPGIAGNLKFHIPGRILVCCALRTGIEAEFRLLVDIL
jgi:hypothetical protein